MANPQLKDIAELAGVSLATASRALSGNGSVSPNTKALVLDAARQLGIEPSETRRPTGCIAFVLKKQYNQEPLSENPFYSKVLRGAEAETTYHGLNLMYMTLDEETLMAGELPAAIAKKQVDGILAVGTIAEAAIETLSNSGLPTLLLNGYVGPANVPKIIIDNTCSARKTTRFLLEKYGPDVACITYDSDITSFVERAQGYRHAFVDMGIDANLARIYKTCEGGYEVAATHFREKLPRAVFCVIDKLAIEVLKWTNENGVKVPRDMAVAGFDDLDVASQVFPALTTTHVYKEEMGSLGVRNLIRLIRGGTIPPTSLLSTKLVVRDSA